MAKYCTKCGFRHENGLTELNFCEGCGNSFNGTAIASAPIASAPIASAPIASAPIATMRPIAVKSAAAARYIAEADEDIQIPILNPADVQVEVDIPAKITITANGVGNAAHLGATRPKGTKFNPDDIQREFADKFKRDRESTRED